MNMSVDEICRNYRQAKDKKEQINILADLNCTSKEEIIKVLVDCGEMYPPESKPKKTAKKQDVELPKLSEPVVHALFARIDEIDKLIKPLEDQRSEIDKQMKPLRDEYIAISVFLNEYDRR